MAKKKRLTKIVESLNSLNKTDVYSMLLFTLYKMQDLPEYSTLCELCYVLDNDNLTKLLAYYGGMTIRIPTLQELRLVVQALLLYQYVNMENGDFSEALDAIGLEYPVEEVKKVYQKLCDVIANYEFERS